MKSERGTKQTNEIRCTHLQSTILNFGEKANNKKCIELVEHKKQHKIFNDKIHIINKQLEKNGNESLKEKQIEQILTSFLTFSKTCLFQLKSVPLFHVVVHS